jgi:hypothetical protein
MHGAFRWFTTLAATGLLAGLVLAVLGVPYGRWNYAAFAELYHGPENTDGTVHVALDCDVSNEGTQSACTRLGGDFDLAVTVGNSTGAALYIGYFNFRVTHDRQDIYDPKTGVGGSLDSNPDFNNEAAPTGWLCTPPPPNKDENVNPLIAVSFLSCYDQVPTVNSILLPSQVAHETLATIHYDDVAQFTSGAVSFTLSDVAIFDETAVELMSCNPVATVAGPCFGASVGYVGEAHDTDGDGYPNSSDNCPTHYNPDQSNFYDGNLISNAPIYAVNDVTRANSDSIGDACDPDAENDGLFGQFSEPLGAPCIPLASSDPYDFDTDDDRVFDGAECLLGTDPTNPNSKPAPSACGSTADVDLDGLNERLERCHYNTDPNTPDTDGDGVKDGCEASSLNTDTVVNSGDQGLLAAEMLRAAPQSEKLVNFDITKDGIINSGDQGVQASRFGKCP